MPPIAPHPRHEAPAVRDPLALRVILIGIAILFLGAFVVAPLCTVFSEAFAQGGAAYVAALTDPETLSALKLTLMAAGIAVPLNVIFGLAAAWLIARFRFPGRKLLLSLIDLPFSVSPVIAGLILVLLLGANTPLGAWLRDHGLQVVFAPPGIVLATIFVTFPFVVREVLPVMEHQGAAEEEAALTLGASGLQIFFKVTLPKVRGALLHGIVLCNARAMGEFGAVSVVSGHVRGETNTLPLHIEILYNDYNPVGAFAVATLLTLLALVTLVVKRFADGGES